MDYGNVLCWATNPVGRQSEPCVYHIIPAGKLSNTKIEKHLPPPPPPHSLITLIDTCRKYFDPFPLNTVNMVNMYIVHLHFRQIRELYKVRKKK